MNSLPRCFRGLLVTAILSPCLISTTMFAQSTNRKIGTQFEVTADPLVPRPHEQPCIVPLFANYAFAHFSDTTQTIFLHASRQLSRTLGESSLRRRL